MAVFTQVSDNDARQLLQHYSLGELVSLRGITAGIENTNYFLTTTTGEYVLTLFEVLKFEQLPFYIELMHYLGERGIPVPRPQALHSGKRLTLFKNKPCAIVTKLSGGYEPEPNPLHCALAGETLARLHLAARDFPIEQANLRALSWWEKTIPLLKDYVNTEQWQQLNTTLEDQQALATSTDFMALPRGPAHCDLFRDNVLFDGTFDQPRMGGIIDFYFAGWDSWLFDVAVSVNDWCIDRTTGVFKAAELDAWLHAYARIRPFTVEEKRCWPRMLQGAALRFWVSRLYDYYHPRPAQALKPHDPGHFERILNCRVKGETPPLPEYVNTIAT